MAKPQKVWNKHKITAIIIILIAIAVVFSIFIELDNPAINHPKSLERSISNYIFASDVQAKIAQIDEHDKYLIVTFTDERYSDWMGIAIFQRGYDLLWHPTGSTYKNGVSVATYYYNYDETFDYVEAENTYYQRFKTENIIYGINVDPRISSVKGIRYNEEKIYEQDPDEPPVSNVKEVNVYQEVLYEQNITETKFINYYSVEDQITEWKFFDADGKDITAELKLEADDSGPDGWISLMGEPGFGSWGLNFIILFFTLTVASIFWAGNSNPIRYSEVKERNEKSSDGFVNKFKNLDKEKKTALYVFVMTLVIAVAFHSVFYSTFNSEAGLTKSIEKYTGDRNVTVLKTEMEDGHIIALYTTEKSYYKGIVAFERGWNGLWSPTEYYTRTDICISSFWIYVGNNYYFIVGGVDCDPRAVSYEYLREFWDYEYVDDEYKTIEKPPVTVYSGNISEPNFIHIYNASNRPVFMPKIYDSAGNNIEPELTEELREEEDNFGGASGSKGMLDLIKIATVGIIFIGFLCAWWIWIEIPKRKEEENN